MSVSSGDAWMNRDEMHGWIERRCMGGSSGGAWVDRVEVHGWNGLRSMGDRMAVH